MTAALKCSPPKSFALVATALALTLGACTDQTKVEGIVKDYLMANPEIIRDAMMELQKKEALAATAQFADTIKANAEALYNDPRDLSIGPKDAKVTVVEFYDYRCGYCHAAAPHVLEMIAKEKDLRFVFKELPILGGPGSPSHIMALASSAAVKQGADKALALHSRLMAATVQSEAQVLEIAKAAGLDVTALQTEMKNPAHEERFKAAYELAGKIGAQGTPAFVIGNQMIPGWDPAAIAKAIETARKG